MVVVVEIELGEFEQLLDPDAGVTKNLDHRETPEGVLLLDHHVETVPDGLAVGVKRGDPRMGHRMRRLVKTHEGAVPGGELLAAAGRACCLQQRSHVVIVPFSDIGEFTDAHRTGAGSLVHSASQRQPPLPVGLDLGLRHRRPACPQAPTSRFLVRHLDEIAVEAAHGHQRRQRATSGDEIALRTPAPPKGLLPLGGDIVGQVDCVDARGDLLDLLPEHEAQLGDQRTQRRVVDAERPFGQIRDQQAAHRAAGDVVAIDEVGDRLLPGT